MIVNSIIKGIVNDPAFSVLGGRVRQTITQEDALPYMEVNRYSGTEDLAHDGPTGLVVSGIQVAVTAATEEQAGELAEAVWTLFHGFYGELEGTTVSRIAAAIIQIDEAALISDSDGYKHTFYVDLRVTHRR